MIYRIQKISRSKIDKMYTKSMKELNSFFPINWTHNLPNLILVPDRETINALKGHKTEDWVVGWADRNEVYLLDGKNFNKESSHQYSDEEFFVSIKHELAHCFSYVLSDFSRIPIWLLEGIAMYVSGEYKRQTKPKRFKNFIDYFDKSGGGVYSESGFAVMFLVEKYGKKKLLSLLKSLKKVKSKADFAKLFKSIYGFELSYKNFKII